MVDPAKVRSTPKHVRSMGAKTPQIKKWNVSREVNRDHESTSSTECAYVPLFFRIKKIERPQKKILLRIEKRSRRLRNEHNSAT